VIFWILWKTTELSEDEKEDLEFSFIIFGKVAEK